MRKNCNKKILVVTFEFPPHKGGIGEYSDQIVRGLVCEGFDVRVFATRGRSCDREIECHDVSYACSIKRFPKFSMRFVNVIARIFFLLKETFKDRPDLIFACDDGASIASMVVAKLSGAKYIVAGHGSEFVNYSYIYQAALNGAEAIVFNSEYTRCLAMKSYRINANDSHVVNLGGDVRRFNCSVDAELVNKLKARIGIKEREMILLTVGRVDDRKAQDLVVNALGLLSEQGVSAHYIIAGRIVNADAVQVEIGQWNLQDKVTMIGQVSDEELPALYSLCDIYIQPSRLSKKLSQVEGFGISLCEASISGKPVIGMRGSGMEDAVEEGVNGLLLSNGSVDELTGAIKKLLVDDGARLALGRTAKEYSLSNLTWSRTCEATISIIRKCMKFE